VLAGHGASLDQSMARVLVAAGDVKMDQSGAALLVANNVHTESGAGTVLLIARNVEGNVTTLFGRQESIIFGVAAGAVAGVILMLGNLFRRRRRH
jgi:hypothetical protein